MNGQLIADKKTLLRIDLNLAIYTLRTINICFTKLCNCLGRSRMLG